MELKGNFRIPEPCHEDWNNMTLETQGRFCASCQRCVVDFTNKSAQEMKAIYDREQGNVCGRVTVNQIRKERPAVRSIWAHWKRIPLRSLQVFAMALLLAFGFSGKADAQVNHPPIMGKIAYVPERTNDKVTIGGRVLDEGGKPATEATVVLSHENGASYEGRTDEKGYYRFIDVPVGTYSISAYQGRQEAYGDGTLKAGRREHQHDLRMETMLIMGELMYVPDELPEEVPLPVDEPIDEGQSPEAVTEEATPFTEDLMAARAPALNAQESIALGGFALRVYPNPAHDRVAVLLEQVGEGKLDFALFDIDGRQLMGGSWTHGMDLRQELSVGMLPSGIYLLRLSAGDEALQRQILKIE